MVTNYYEEIILTGTLPEEITLEATLENEIILTGII